MKHVSASNCISIDHSHNGLRNFTNFFVEVQYIQAWNTVLTYIATHAFYVLITSATKRFFACAGKYHYVDVFAFATDVHGFQHLVVGLRSKGVINTFSIYGDFSDSFKKFEADVAIRFDCFPCSHNC